MKIKVLKNVVPPDGLIQILLKKLTKKHALRHYFN